MHNSHVLESEKHFGDVVARLAIDDHGNPAISLLFQPPGMHPCEITDLYEASPTGREKAIAIYERLTVQDVQLRLCDFHRYFVRTDCISFR